MDRLLHLHLPFETRQVAITSPINSLLCPQINTTFQMSISSSFSWHSFSSVTSRNERKTRKNIFISIFYFYKLYLFFNLNKNMENSSTQLVTFNFFWMRMKINNTIIKLKREKFLIWKPTIEWLRLESRRIQRKSSCHATHSWRRIYSKPAGKRVESSKLRLNFKNSTIPSRGKQRERLPRPSSRNFWVTHG